MTNFFDNQNLLETLWKWKKHLIVVGILAVVFSAFFSSSLFIKPKYKSTARIYPSKNIYVFSDESESEQLLEIIGAQDIKLRLIDAFDLSKVYKISKNEPQYLTYMMSEFNDNISFKKNEYETVEISVLDTDPKRAAAMCDSIIAFLDEKILIMHRIKYVESATVTKKEMNLIMHQIDSVKTRMDFLRKEYNILDYGLQTKEITEGMVEVLVKQKSNSTDGKRIEKWMKDLAEYGGEFDMLNKQQLMMVTQLEALKKIYDEAISGSSKKIIYGQRIQNPIPADKKSYPVRSLIVFFSTFAALFTAILVILFLENKKNV
jgi:capsular polysaccharide biosynthesis protein